MQNCNIKGGATLGLVVGLMALAWAGPSQALVVQADYLALYKNGALLYEDNFDNNLTPSQESSVYTVSGAFPNGAESGGKLTIDSAWGTFSTNALGQVRQTMNVTGLTGLASSNPTSLGRTDLISFGSVFDILNPVGPLNNGYGVVLRESSLSSPATTHTLALQVTYQASVGTSLIRFYEQDFVAGTVTVLGQIPFTVPLGADQIALELSNEDTKDTSFAAWYAFGTNGVFGTAETFSAVGTMFTATDFVRPQIQVYSAVPEPSAWALCGAALFGLGTLRRRDVAKRRA